MVAGVPTAGLPAQGWRHKVTFKVRGKTPEAPADKLFEAFVPGETNRLRRRVVRALKESGELSVRGVSVEVDDLGEIIPEGLASRNFQGSFGLGESEMVEAAKQFAEESKGYDLSILVGGDHAGALLLYGFEGRVARFDEHSDSCDSPDTCPKPVMRNNYVCAAIRVGLKSAGEILGVGIREGKGPYETVPHAKDCSVLDIDLDVLAQKHGVKTRYSKGNLSPDDLVGAVRANAPRAIGFFEAVEGDEAALALVEKLAVEAAIACAKNA